MTEIELEKSVAYKKACTKIENAIFPYKTALSEANFKANRMRSIKRTYHKVLLVTTLFF